LTLFANCCCLHHEMAGWQQSELSRHVTKFSSRRYNDFAYKIPHTGILVHCI